MALWTAVERARIESKIQEVEAQTAGEIVVASVNRSDSYAGLRLFYATILTLVSAAALTRFLPGIAGLWLLAVQIPFSGVYWMFLGLPLVLRWLLPRDLRAQAVQHRALRMFTERAVFATRDQSGVLILLSELEHRVVILGDQGIHDRIQLSGWERHVDVIVASIRKGRAAEGVCEVLDALRLEMGQRFPQRPDDENELPDAVVEERE